MSSHSSGQGDSGWAAYFTAFTKQFVPTDEMGNPVVQGHKIVVADEGSLAGSRPGFGWRGSGLTGGASRSFRPRRDQKWSGWNDDPFLESDMRNLVAGLVLLACSAGAWADTYPAHVLIIRHAEKPTEGAGLSPEGKARAAALPQLFMKSRGRPTPFPKPDFVFAAKTSGESHRPLDTVKPLAEKLGLKVHADIKDKQYKELVAELFTKPKYAGKTVLICWHHGQMPKLARALHGSGIPKKIDEDVYGLIWQINYAKDGTATTTLGSQKLMPGD